MLLAVALSETDCEAESHWLRCLFAFTATVFNNANQQINVYGDDVEVDYRGYEVRERLTYLSA